MAQTKEQAHAWYLANKARRKAITEKNKDHVAAVKHAYYLRVKAERKASDRARYLAKRDEKLAWQKRYYRDHADAVKAIGKAWRTQHKQRVKKNSRAYRTTHRDDHQVHNAKRRALKAGSPIGAFTANDWTEMKAAYRHRCVYCERKKPLTQDHVIPLSKGGKHDKTNIVPACGPCNSRKNTRPAPPFQVVLYAV